MVAATGDLGTRIYEKELTKHLDEAARLAALLGLSFRELQRRAREAADELADAVKEKR